VSAAAVSVISPTPQVADLSAIAMTRTMSSMLVNNGSSTSNNDHNRQLENLQIYCAMNQFNHQRQLADAQDALLRSLLGL
jgi:hypothetical protein